MEDPVVASDGFSYERIFIEDWLKKHSTSPKTGANIKKTLFPNTNLKIRIQELMESNDVDWTRGNESNEGNGDEGDKRDKCDKCDSVMRW